MMRSKHERPKKVAFFLIILGHDALFLFTAAPGRMRKLQAGLLANTPTSNKKPRGGGCAQTQQIANINKFNPTYFVYFLGTGAI